MKKIDINELKKGKTYQNGNIKITPYEDKTIFETNKAIITQEKDKLIINAKEIVVSSSGEKPEIITKARNNE